MQWQYTGGTNQQWIFEPVSGQSAQPTAGPTQRPTAAPTQRPADPTKAPQPSGKGLVLSYGINDWGSGYQVNMKVKNEGGTAVNGWTLKIKKSDINVASFWNVKVAESGDSYVITPLDWNRSIPAGGSIEFGICGSGHASSSIGYTFS
jgi:arabinoxylan arabinofuranohydrolase